MPNAQLPITNPQSPIPNSQIKKQPLRLGENSRYGAALKEILNYKVNSVICEKSCLCF